MIRKPAVAGYFYSATSAELTREVNQHSGKPGKIRDVMGIVSPHAGLVYSGAVAGAVYSSIALPRSCIMIGPNHTGAGVAASLMASGHWEIPTGTLQIDETLSRFIAERSEHVEEDSSAHAREHSLEVQLPFILDREQDTGIVPITMMTLPLETCREIGETIADAISSVDYRVMIIASSDMSHYEPDETARQKDRTAIDRILNLDPEGLYNTVLRERISMCGYIPVTTMLYAVQKLGASRAELVKYMTSGEINGDYSQVVGYAGITIE